MEFINKIFELDLGKFVPEMTDVLEKTRFLVKFSVLAGPILLLAIGLMYLLFPPKEANHKLGFRTYFGMGSVEAWQFTQRLAGVVWSALGLILTVVMAVVCGGFKNLEQDQMMARAATAIGWELGLVIVSIIAINVTLMVLFDAKGYRRRRNRI